MKGYRNILLGVSYLVWCLGALWMLMRPYMMEGFSGQMDYTGMALVLTGAATGVGSIAAARAMKAKHQQE